MLGHDELLLDGLFLPWSGFVGASFSGVLGKQWSCWKKVRVQRFWDF